MRFHDDYEQGWWRHSSHRKKVAQASHDALQVAINRGRRALRNNRLLEIGAKTAGFTFAVFVMLWLAIHILGGFPSR